MKQLEIETIVIACTGLFNPSIVIPEWLRGLDLISKSDSTGAKVDIISSQITQFKLPWCSITATGDKFEISSSLSPYFESVRDLFTGIFMTLQHDIITNLKLSHIRHYQMLDKSSQYKILDKFSSEQSWKSTLKDPELLTLQMYGSRSDRRAGMILVEIGPSTLITNGIQTQIMDILSFSSDTGTGSLTAIEALRDIWAPSMRERDKIVNWIFKS